jgi:hypothetical protein
VPKKKTPKMPALSMAALDSVQKTERYALSALRECDHTWSFNQEAALRILRTCAVTVFDRQVDFYQTLPNFHPNWIVQIAESTIDSTLALKTSHHLDYAEARNELIDTLAEHQAQKEADDQRVSNTISGEGSDSQTKLFLAYKTKYPEARKLDVCWAAKQHYRDWKRWVKGEFKSGSTPDLAFRKVLNSGKSPREIRKEPRPKGWQ